MKKPAWIKKQTLTKNYKEIKGSYHPYRDWKQDSKGYFLIRVDKKNKLIELAHCNNNHEITATITGKKAQELYMTAIKLNLLSLLDHAAYLGKELKKAELALKNNSKYIQE